MNTTLCYYKSKCFSLLRIMIRNMIFKLCFQIMYSASCLKLLVYSQTSFCALSQDYILLLVCSETSSCFVYLLNTSWCPWSPPFFLASNSVLFWSLCFVKWFSGWLVEILLIPISSWHWSTNFVLLYQKRHSAKPMNFNQFLPLTWPTQSMVYTYSSFC